MKMTLSKAHRGTGAALILAVASTAFGQWNTDVQVQYEGRTQSFSGNERPFRNGNIVYLPARAMSGKIGGGFDRDDSGRNMRFTWRDRRVDYRKGDTYFSFNGKRYSMPRASTERNGVLLVPANLFFILTGYRVTVLGMNNGGGNNGGWQEGGDNGGWQGGGSNGGNNGGGWGDGGDVRIRLNGRDLSFGRDEQPYRSRNVVFVHVRAMASRTGVGMERTQDGKRIWLSREFDKITYDKGNSYMFNDSRRGLPASSQERNGALYVPIQLFSALLGRSLTWQSNNGNGNGTNGGGGGGWMNGGGTGR
ncbi:MAG: stalk domain-containing protein [Fimbriimonadaceae bacterium]|nr:stalk domain-containing protein [Fimbriimonadaceae bacterium]